MKNDPALIRRLKEAGMTEDMLAQYRHYLESGNRHGQERLLCRLRRAQSELLAKDREKLMRLDYIITRVSNTDKI